MKIRIVHCLQTIFSGGVERRRLLMVKYLPKDIFEHKFICTKALEPLKSEFLAHGAEIVEVGDFTTFFELNKYRHVRRLIRDWKPHIVHGAVFEGVSMSVFGSVFNNVPILITEETSDPRNRSEKANFLLRVMLKACDYAVAISPSVATYLKEKAGVPQRKLRLINNGVLKPQPVDADVVERLRGSLRIRKEDFIIGSVGRLVDDHKKFSDLMKALAIIRNTHPNARLLIVGDGPDRQRLEDFAKANNVYDDVIFAGFQADTGPFYAMMDIFALASSREGFGLVIIEAMFSKLPVIATRVGGIRDIIQSRHHGILVDPGAVDQMVSALLLLLDNESERLEIGEGGYRRATDNYSAETYVNNVEKLYREAVVRRLPPQSIPEP